MSTSMAVQPLDAYLAGLRAVVETALASFPCPDDTPPVVAEPIRYALLGGGKRLRPCLTLAVAEALAPTRGLSLDEARSRALPAACAVEMIHTYSLVHDDLPAMDNDALRRGRPTTHVVYGDGLAILAGDGLLTDAFARLANPGRAASAAMATAEQRLRALAVLAHAAGSCGMVGGQAIDLAAVGRAHDTVGSLDSAALEDMHRRKTGALIRAASVMGAILVGAAEQQIVAVDDYARDLGLAFQIVDDVLDVEGSATDLGKTAGKDAAAGKPTFPALYGLAGSRQLAEACVSRAKESLVRGAVGGRLADIAEWSLGRRH